MKSDEEEPRNGHFADDATVYLKQASIKLPGYKIINQNQELLINKQ